MEPAISPVGRLFIRLPAIAETTPAVQLACTSEWRASAAEQPRDQRQHAPGHAPEHGHGITPLTPMDQPGRGDTRAEGRQTQLSVQGRGHQQQRAGQHDAQRAQPRTTGKRLDLQGRFQRLADLLAQGQPQHQVGQADSSKGGIWLPNTTRLAGLEMGSTKLAALAMKAQMNR